MEIKLNQTTLKLVCADITEQPVDAVVNAANAQLVLGGGVAGAIRRKGGPAIQAECDQKGPAQVGQAVLTTAGSLKAEYVIHAVGPRMGEGDEDEKLRQATLNTLRLADEHHLTSLAFCALSTGIFGFPMDRCAEVMLKNTIDYLSDDTSLKTVIFCLYDQAALSVFERQLNCLL